MGISDGKKITQREEKLDVFLAQKQRGDKKEEASIAYGRIVIHCGYSSFQTEHLNPFPFVLELKQDLVM